MKPILIGMLCAQVGVLLAVAHAHVLRKPAPSNRISYSQAFTLFVTGVVSNIMAANHLGARGADLVGHLGTLLMGMALMTSLLLVRQRREA